MIFNQPPLPLDVARLIDEICCDFESSWQVKTPLVIDDLLSRVDASHRGDLLSELLLLEFHYRQITQPEMDIQDYCRRFPEHRERVEHAWHQCCGHRAQDTSGPSSVVTPQTIQAQYAKQTLHRQGGVGRVWIAFDRNLERHVALKDLQPQFAQNPQVREQFIREAHLTGKLEHPNIVPVYQLRQGNDLVDPFYTMRLVEGKTLRELAADYHGEHQGTAHHRREFVNLLNVLATVCQTVAYAHSQNVVHRDLKPDNVVVGSYGEIFVLDWGLAKSLADSGCVSAPRGEMPAATTLDPGSLDTQSQTQAILGTPAYMSPEQAAGQTERTGVATDVYGLGAILFEILTGHPPHHAEDTTELLRRVQHEPTPLARVHCRTVPAALSAICGKAMAKDPVDRYDSPLVMRDDIQAWIADEPVACYGEPWWERCSRWVRGHRRFINTAALLMLLTTIGLAIGNQLLNQANRQTQREKDNADRALVAAESARDALQETTQKAEQDYHEAREIIEVLSEAINSEQAQGLHDFKPLQRQLNQEILAFFSYHLAEHGDDPLLREETANVYFQLGLLAKSLETLDAAQQHQEKAAEILGELRRERPGAMSYRRKLCACYDQLAMVLLAKGDLAAAEARYVAAIQLIRPLAEGGKPQPQDLNRLRILLNNLGNLFLIRGEFSEAESFFQKILASRQDETATPRISLAAYLNLAIIYRHQGEVERWDACQREAGKLLDLLKPHAAEERHFREEQVRWYVSQANLESTRERWEAVLEKTTQGIQAAESLAADDPHVPEYQLSLGLLKLNASGSLQISQRTAEAQQFAQEAVALLEPLHQADAKNIHYEIALAKALHNLAMIEWSVGEHAAAIKTVQRALAMKRSIVNRIPQDQYLLLQLTSQLLYARFLLTANETQKALQEYRQLQPQARMLAKKHPEQLSMQTLLARTLQKQALAEKKNKEWDVAQEHFREAHKLHVQRLQRGTQRFVVLLDLFEVEYNLGNVYLEQSQHMRALQQYQQARETLLQLAKTRQQPLDVRKKHVDCLWALAETCHALQQYETALEHWSEAIEASTDPRLTAFLTRARQKTAEMISPP